MREENRSNNGNRLAVSGNTGMVGNGRLLRWYVEEYNEKNDVKIKLIETTAGDDAAAQETQIRDLLNRDVDVVISGAIDTTAIWSSSPRHMTQAKNSFLLPKTDAWRTGSGLNRSDRTLTTLHMYQWKLPSIK